MWARALRCLLLALVGDATLGILLGDGLVPRHSPACLSQPSRTLRVVRMAEVPEELSPVLRDEPQAMDARMSETSIEKGTFGGGSGGTATLDDADFSVNTILKQLESIQQGTPKNIVILGTRHCSFLHQQIIELLSYALVLSDNHIFTSGATGTHAATIRGALRAENPDLLTVILPQTLGRQPREIRDLLGQVHAG